jgi:hypothetical protein
MRKAPFLLAGILVAGLSHPASAQMVMPTQNMPTGLDCTNSENALEYYCNHRDQFDKSGRFIGPSMTAGTTTMAPEVTTTAATRVHHSAHQTRHH